MEDNKDIPKTTAPKKRPYRWLRILGRIAAGFIVLFILLVLFIRSPWGQSLIVDKFVTYISNKTSTEVAIERLFITFDGNIQLEGLYLEDTQGDTLIYSKSLEANMPLWALIRGKGIGVDVLTWEGLRANIIRKDFVAGYNFQFLIDAFAPADTTTTVVDTTSTPLHIVLGQLNFKAIDLVYEDAVTGIDSRFQIGELQADMRKTDVEHMVFEVSSIALSNSNLTFKQSPVRDVTNENPTQPPFLVIDAIQLTNVFANYQSFGDRIAATLDLKELSTSIPKLNLENRDFDISYFDLKNSTIVLQTQTETNVVTEKIEDVTEDIEQDIKTFEWPELRLSLGSLNLQNNQFRYNVASAEAKEGSFNPNAIALADLNLQANAIVLKDKVAGFHLENASFKEISGMDLKALSLTFHATDNTLKIDDLTTILNDNHLQAELRLDYPALSTLIEVPEHSKINVDIPTFQIALHDIFLFQPQLKQNPYLNTLSKRLITGSLKADGYLSNLQLPKMNVNWGNTTRISAHGQLQNINQTDHLQFNIPKLYAATTRKDLLQFFDEKTLGVSLPAQVELSVTTKGKLSDITANATLTTSQGLATLAGNFKNDQTLAFNADLQIDQYKLNELLQNEQLGTLSLDIKAQGKGKTLNDLDAHIEATVQSFAYNHYPVKDLKLVGDIKDGQGHVTSNYKDYNLDMGLYASVVLDSIAPEANVELDIKGANLKALGLMTRDVKTGMKVYADFKGNSSSYDIAAIVDDGVVVYDNKTYLIGDLNALAHVRKDTTSVSVKNKIVDILLQSNADPQTFSTSLRRHLTSYFYPVENSTDTLIPSVNLRLKGEIMQAPLLNEVFLVNVEDLDTVKIAVDFHESERQLKANITAPHINYSGYQLDSLAFTMDTDRDKFMFDFGFNQIQAGPFNIKKTILKGHQEHGELSLDLLAFDDAETLIQIQSKITGNEDSKSLRFHIIPTDLILNKTAWVTPETNEILISKNKLAFNDFRFSKDQQSIEISDQLPAIAKDHIAIDFEGFQLHEFLSYLNPDKEFARGHLNGQFIIEEPFDNTGLVADMNISQLNLMEVDLGNLHLDAKSLGGNSYDFNAAMKEGEVDLDVKGDYIADKTGAKLNILLDINRFNMTALHGFTLGQITETDGSFSGNFKVSGTSAKPTYEGSLTFTEADFKIAMFNAPFTLQNETLSINNEGLSMQNFTIQDENKHTFVASGNIGTASFINPTFDLTVKADNFQLLNATKDDNNFLYGKASFGGDAKITGDLQIPVVAMNLTVSSDTNVTYVMPSSTANIEERDGVVQFVNRNDPDAILTRTEEKTATLRGFDINALLKVHKDAQVTIIIDPQTGDNFKVSGEGDFDFTMNPNGTMTLSGVYEVNSGHYEMSLYNLVNRKFNITSGSRVTWSGDPFDAKLDVKALYEVKASASSLMAPVFSGADPSVTGKFRQVLPFYVYLNIDGLLMEPKINFNLDMPEEEQGAIGGQVYGRVQQLNQQEDELNRQVFSLLVLNRFYPDPGSDGSSGGVASIARDNLNDAVSDQLNMFSDKLLGNTGFELNFGLDSYTDYQGSSPQERTQLDIAAQKKLFNDRLIVSVGSEVDVQGKSAPGEETPLIGNVSIEYILSENGRYRLKGFRRDTFENVIDGQTIVSGIALIFTQEFNKFSELWQALLKSKTDAEVQEEAKLKAEKKAAEAAQKAKQEATNESIEQKKD